jgi:hypothetical protein
MTFWQMYLAASPAGGDTLKSMNVIFGHGALELHSMLTTKNHWFGISSSILSKTKKGSTGICIGSSTPIFVCNITELEITRNIATVAIVGLEKISWDINFVNYD